MLRLASLVFLVGTVSGFRLVKATAVAAAEEPPERALLRSAGIVQAARAMGLLRAIVGFLTFLVAFGFRRAHAPSWEFGVVLAASMLGAFAGAVVAPRLRASVREERILLAALFAVGAAGLAADRWGEVRLLAAVLAAVVGIAASAAKLAFDAIVQRDAHDAARGRAFARFETRFQLMWVVGAFVPVVVAIPLRTGFLVIAIAAAGAWLSYAIGQHRARRRLPGLQRARART